MTYPDPLVVAELESWKRLSFDVDESPNVVSAFGVRSIPTAVAIDSEGRVLATIQGVKSPEAFAAALEKARTQR